ncbi:hypothetical protein JZX86_05975 [Agrobacterium rosae]|uniref:hypothetical protein n=1 Tax=Agrobacterium rosae TaxID=1972867 RepID=UPI0019D38250|nr:hypothetical protein [Agrobacterium rosae]MBN7804912.1 hypothetical protein [Agrobacterium rosae]
MGNTEFRYRIEMRVGSSQKWLDTGLALKPQSGADGSVVVIADVPVTEAHLGVLQVSESNIFDPRRETFEEFNTRQKANDDLEALRKEIDGLKRHVAALTSKFRVVADINLARSLRDLDRRGMV